MNRKIMITLCIMLCTSMFFMLSTKVNNAEQQTNVYSGNAIEDFEAMRSNVLINEKAELNFKDFEFDLEDCEVCGIGEMDEVVITTITTTTRAVTTPPKPTATKKPQTTTKASSTVVTTTAPSGTTAPAVTTSSSTSESVTSGTTPSPAPSPSPVTDMAKQIFEIVNQKREAAGKKAYVLDEKLCEIANMRAKELTTKFSHTRPNGKKYASALDEYAYSYSAVGENIAYGYSSASAVMNKWLSSAPHKANILDSNKVGYTKIGIGYYNKNGTKYYVQMFVK